MMDVKHLLVPSSSWETTCVVAMGAAAGVGASAFLFVFRNASQAGAKLIPVFCMTGGAGIGGWSSSVVLPDLKAHNPIPLTPIGSNRPFSINELDGSAARISCLGVGLIVGYSAMWISAYTSSGPLFESQDVSGPGLTSISIGLYEGVGLWCQWAAADKELKKATKKVLKSLPHATISQG